MGRTRKKSKVKKNMSKLIVIMIIIIAIIIFINNTGNDKNLNESKGSNADNNAPELILNEEKTVLAIGEKYKVKAIALSEGLSLELKNMDGSENTK